MTSRELRLSWLKHASTCVFIVFEMNGAIVLCVFQALRIIRSMFSALDTVVDSEVGCEKVHGFLQYPALVKSLAYTLVDMLLMRAFQGFQAHGLPHASI